MFLSFCLDTKGPKSQGFQKPDPVKLISTRLLSMGGKSNKGIWQGVITFWSAIIFSVSLFSEKLMDFLGLSTCMIVIYLRFPWAFPLFYELSRLKLISV